MSLASDLSALAIARATKAALSASLPPCSCGGSAWVAGKGGALVCGECGTPAAVGGNASAREAPREGGGAGMTGGSREGGGERSSAADVVPLALAVGGGGGGVEGGSANPGMLVVDDPAVSGGGTDFPIVTAPAVPASAEVQVGVLRGKVTRQRRGTVEFYEDAKAAHRMSMRSMRAYIRKKLKQPGGVLEAMQDPAYRWCVEQVGKFAHSQAPREIKAETKLLIEFDMG